MRRPPQERSNPGGEFGEGEGFGQVVVRSQVQPLHPVFHAVATGQNEDGQSRLGFADVLEHIQPIHPRQGQVEDRHVIFKLANHELRFITVLRNVHGVLLGFQSLLYETGHRFVVFCYEDSHLLTFSEGQTLFGPASVTGRGETRFRLRSRLSHEGLAFINHILFRQELPRG